MKERALNFVQSNPGAFWRLTEKRAVLFWTQPQQLWPYPWLLFLTTLCGIVQSARCGKRCIEFLSVLLLYPPIYYVTHVFARFRYPIEPLMYTLSGYFVYSLIGAGGHGSRSQHARKKLPLAGIRYGARGGIVHIHVPRCSIFKVPQQFLILISAHGPCPKLYVWRSSMGSLSVETPFTIYIVAFEDLYPL